MPEKSTSKGVVNFLKVTGSALVQPTRLASGAMAVTAAALIPSIALPALVGGGIAILAMSWADINDPNFIAKTLRPRSGESLPYTKRLEQLVKSLDDQIKRHSTYAEVTSDIKEAKDSLQKITEVINNLSPAEASSLEFVISQLEKLTTRLIDLISKEQLARRFLETEDLNATENEVKKLENIMKSTSDRIAKDQIRKAIHQKKSQLMNYRQVDQRLVRIDAYLANIRAALYSTYTNLAKLQLKEDYSIVDEAEVLTDSLTQVVNELDTLADSQIDIAIEENSTKDSEPQKITS